MEFVRVVKSEECEANEFSSTSKKSGMSTPNLPFGNETSISDSRRLPPTAGNFFEDSISASDNQPFRSS